MIYDLQKASVTKRISAFLLDVIIFLILAVGVAALVSHIVGYDGYMTRFDEIKKEYAAEYGIDLDISDEKMAELSQEDKAKYDAASAAFAKDEEAISLYQTMLSYILLIMSLAPFFACLIVDFVIPLFLGNGQTLGKKIFGLGVMMTNGVKITAPALFVRALLGKYVLETAVPTLLLVMAFFELGSTFLFLALAMCIGAANLAFLCFNSKRALIHDYLSYTVCVDMSSQMIFDNVDQLEEYKARLAADKKEVA